MTAIQKEIGSTGNRAWFKILDNEEALPWLGLTHSAPGLAVQVNGTSLTVDVSTWQGHGAGWYSVSVPNSHYAAAGVLRFTGSITGGTFVREDVHQVVAAIITPQPPPTAEENATAVLTAAAETPIPADIWKANGQPVQLVTEIEGGGGGTRKLEVS